MNPEICKKCMQIHSQNEIKLRKSINEIKEVAFFDYNKFTTGNCIDTCWMYITTKYTIKLNSSFCRKMYKINELPEDIVKELKGKISVIYKGKKEINRVLKKLNPVKGCHYYIEHQMNNWNKN